MNRTARAVGFIGAKEKDTGYFSETRKTIHNHLEVCALRTTRWFGREGGPALTGVAVMLLCAGLAAPVYAQQPGWATRAGGTDFDEGRGIAMDAAGNSVVTGGFTGPATFGAGEANKTILTSHAGSTDVFVAKYAANGALIWATRAGGKGIDEGLGIAVDAAGTSNVTGRFSGSATFGPGERNRTILTSAGENDLFVAKYDPNGLLLWAKQAGGTGIDEGFGIAVDAAGNSTVTGFFFGTATFGTGEANQTTLTSAGFNDIFVAKYDPNGLLLWAKQVGDTSGDIGFGIAVDASGTSYVTGRFSGSATFGPGEANETTLTGNDVFVAKYGPDGSLLWAKAVGGAFNAGAIAVDAAGNSTVTGSFVDPVIFGAGEANRTTLTSAGGNDIFVAKYDPNGLLLWAKRAGGTDEEFARDIAVDAARNGTVTGFFRGTATFGAGEANETTLTSAGDFDIFVAKYDPNGVLLEAKRAGGTDRDQGLGIAVDAGGNSYATGLFFGAATFGTGEARLTTLTSAGENDIFVAKLTYGVTVTHDATTGICPRSALFLTVVETTPALNAADIDVSSVRLAGAAPSSCSLEDADGDGDLDLICKFPGSDFDLGSGSVVAILTGSTFSSAQIQGDPIKLYRCR